MIIITGIIVGIAMLVVGWCLIALSTRPVLFPLGCLLFAFGGYIAILASLKILVL